MLGSIYPLHRIARIATVAAMLIAAGWLVQSQAARDGAPPSPPRTAGFVVRSSRPLMGTMFHISAWAPAGSQPQVAEAIQLALDGAALLEKTISSWDAESETSAVNRAAGLEPVDIGQELHELLATSLAWSRRTDGAFDITTGPLVELWKQARRERVVPTQPAIADRLAMCGFENVGLGKSTVRLRRSGMQIGFGAIGKGFAADRIAEALQKNGVHDFIIDAGGDILVRGSRGAVPWRVAIRDPRARGHLAAGQKRRPQAAGHRAGDGRELPSAGR